MPEIVGRLRPPRLSTPPASPAVGEMYYDVDDNVLYFWDGTAWISTKSTAGTIYDSDQIGTVKSFTGTVIPTNWMLADGRVLNRIDYPQLADAMGISAGATTFALPDLRNKFIYGASAPSGSPWSGGGAATHALTAAESGMPSHYHNSISVYANRNFVGVGGLGGNEASNQGDYGPYAIQHVAAAGPLNASSAHNNMPPYILLAQIIKVTGAQIDAGGALVGPPGEDGVLEVYEQPAQPSSTALGAMWIDTDETLLPTLFVARAKARRDTAFTMQNSAWHLLPFDAEEFDNDSIHDLSTNPHRLTCKTPGVYEWACHLMMSVGGFTAGAGFFAYNLQKNQDTIGGYPVQQGGAYTPMIGGIGPSISCGGIVTLANVGDWLTLMMYQNGTGTCTLNAGSYFAMWRVA